MFKTFYRGNTNFGNKFMPGASSYDEEDWSDDEEDEEGAEGEAAEYGGGTASASDNDGQRRRFKVNQLAREFAPEEDF